MRYLTFALGKGRLANQTLELFEKIGITCEEMTQASSGYIGFMPNFFVRMIWMSSSSR